LWIDDHREERMRRLTALGAAWLVLAALSGIAMAQGLSDVRLGNEAFRQGDHAAAIGHYTDAIRSGELVGEALAITYNNRGVAHGEAGEFDPAIADYSQALALRPGDATTIRNLRVAHVRRGEVSFASGAYDAAIADFTLAVELEPDHHLAYQRRGELHAERGMLDLAVEDLERAAELSPGDPAIVAALERVAQQREAIVAAGEREGPAAGEPTPMAGVEEQAAPEALVAEQPPTSGTSGPDPASPEPETAEETADAASAEPDVAARPEPAPRDAAPEPEPAAQEPAAAPETTEPERTVEVAPEPAAPAPGQAAAPGEPYRVISAVNYRAGPDNGAQRLGTVDAGRIVRVTGDTLGWKHVILPNGERGFIYQTWLERVNE
jgi:tetratricopeptide (TPR) repeat protein